MAFIWQPFFFAVDNGTSGGISALIVGVQPVLTAVFAGLVLSERLSLKAWLGMALGFVGITLVVWQQAGDTGGWIGITSCITGLIGGDRRNPLSETIWHSD